MAIIFGQHGRTQDGTALLRELFDRPALLGLLIIFEMALRVLIQYILRKTRNQECQPHESSANQAPLHEKELSSD